MTVKLTDGTWKPRPKKPKTVTVTLERMTHIGEWELPASDRRFYVVVGKDYLGHIKRSVESTDRNVGNIRVPGKGRPAWQWWRAADLVGSSPGIHEPNRAMAVAHVLGYEFGEQV